MNKTLNTIIVMLFALVLLLVSSFAWTDPQVYLLLEEINGLKADDQVIFMDIPVGYVDDINLFEEALDQKTYFVVTMVIQKDKFSHLYREMNFNVKSVFPLSAQKQLVIDDNNVMKLNRLQRNEYLIGHTNNQDFVARALKIMGQIDRETKPIRDHWSSQVRTRIQDFVDQLNTSAPDSTAK